MIFDYLCNKYNHKKPDYEFQASDFFVFESKKNDKVNLTSRVYQSIFEVLLHAHTQLIGAVHNFDETTRNDDNFV